MKSHSHQDRPGSPREDPNLAKDMHKAEWLVLKEALSDFRELARTSSERPEAFWEWQRKAVHLRMSHKQLVPRRPLVWILASAAVAIMILSVVFFLEQQQTVRADFAAGSDQQLLLEIDRELERDGPSALEAAALFPEEIFPNGRITPAP